jgi:leucyl-tRNA synthetase
MLLSHELIFCYFSAMNFKTITDLCRELRKNETPQERVLWRELKNRNFFGVKFKRQQPFVYETRQGKQCFFIADFYCAQRMLIIELDGRVHDFQKDYDANRDEILAGLGLKTIRITNDDLENNRQGTLDLIEQQLQLQPKRFR